MAMGGQQRERRNLHATSPEHACMSADFIQLAARLLEDAEALIAQNMDAIQAAEVSSEPLRQLLFHQTFGYGCKKHSVCRGSRFLFINQAPLLTLLQTFQPGPF
jgi:hypothetical protein